MEPEHHILETPVDGRPVHRRHVRKTDGRDLFLYGYAPHTAPRIPGEDLALLTGSEMRRHPLRGDWAVYAAARQQRTFKPSAADNPLAPSQPGRPLTEIPFEAFELAVFANRFPSFHQAAEPPVSGNGTNTHAASGFCDVVVYTPENEGSLATLSQNRRRLLIAAWIDRYAAMFEAGCAYVLPFENRGDAVGVTLSHPHGQIYGFPVVPQPQKAAAEAFEAGYDLAADVASWEPRYTIARAGGCHAYAPVFTRFPYEVWISADVPVSGPWAFSEEQADGFAHLLGDVVRRYDTHFGQQTPYMLTLHASPRGRDDRFQFTAQFYPLLRAKNRLKYLASVEQATGIFTVDVMPEFAADALRGAV